MRWLRWMLLFGTFSACLQLPAQSAALLSVVERAQAAGSFSGVVVVARDGKVSFVKAVGFADRERRVPMTASTVFRLASQTKQVTALLIMQEVSKGHISLNTRSEEVLPGLASYVGRVTVRQLLQHVSGLANPSDGPGDVVPPFYLRVDAAAADSTKAAFGPCSAPPKRAPSLQFEYNNCDYLVLGALLERCTGKSYATLVRERITQPLGLTSWGMFEGDLKRAPTVAKGYSADGKDELFQNPATYGPAGGLYGNALDLAKWDEALLTYKLLPKADTRTMFTADPSLYGEALGSWSYEARGAAGPVRVVERQGEIGGTRLLNNLLPDMNTAVIVIANTERADLFNTYSKRGLGYDLLKEVASLR